MNAITRTLTLRTSDRTVEIPVRIFWPERNRDSWLCRWEIGWPDRVQSNAAGGVDAIQALRIALEMIGGALYTCDHHEAGALAWLRSGHGYGFPVPPNIRDRLVGHDRDFP